MNCILNMYPNSVFDSRCASPDLLEIVRGQLHALEGQAMQRLLGHRQHKLLDVVLVVALHEAVILKACA